jgi:hypothetical protein
MLQVGATGIEEVEYCTKGSYTTEPYFFRDDTIGVAYGMM